MSKEIAILTSAGDVDVGAWNALADESPVASWFQTPEAYDFFAGLSFLEAFVVAVKNGGKLRGVVIGYVQKDGGRIKQFFSRRAIVIGGPLLASDISNVELVELLNAVKNSLRQKSIYIETRNFNDYSQWKDVFESCGFRYEPHLNFHVRCADWNQVEVNIGKHRRRYIRLSLKNGASIVEHPTKAQIRDFYLLLEELYKTKIKAPLFPYEFFDSLFAFDSCRYVMIEYDNKIVGGSVCVFTDKAVYEWFACGKDGINKNIYPSSLTKYAGIKFANEKGCKVFDMMGAGKPNEEYGVRDFKAEFGGDLVEHGRNIYICNRLLYDLGKLGVKLLKKL